MAFAALTVKATRLCNLRCTYCHDWRVGPNQVMPFPVLARTIATALRDPTHDAVDFYWHGGEPTVLPVSFYEKALLVQARFRRPGQVVRNAIQTNGTRLTPNWARFLSANAFSVGVSVDGPASGHDGSRRYASGAPSFEDTVAGIAHLRANGLAFTVLMVVDERTVARGAQALLDFLTALNAPEYALLPVKPLNRPDSARSAPAGAYLAPRAFAAFLQELYDQRRTRGEPAVRIRELDALRWRLAGGAPTVCTLAGDCFGRYYLIEPNGDVAHCNLFVGDPRYTVGNILHDDFAMLRTRAQLLALQEVNPGALATPRSCPEFDVCNGGCPHDRYLSLRHDPEYDDSCCGLRDLIAHIRSKEPRTVLSPQHSAPVIGQSGLPTAEPILSPTFLR